MFLPAVRTYLPSSSHPVSLSTLAEYTPRGHQNCRQSGGGGRQVYYRCYTIGWRQKFGFVAEKIEYVPASRPNVSPILFASRLLSTLADYKPIGVQNHRQPGVGVYQVCFRGFTIGWRQKIGSLFCFPFVSWYTQRHRVSDK